MVEDFRTAIRKVAVASFGDGQRPRGCVVAISVHLLWHDSVFIPSLQRKWAALPAQTMFDGVSAYRLELQVLGVVAFAAIGVPIVGIIWRYLRAWWAGIVSLTTLVAAFITAKPAVYFPIHD